MDITLKTVPYGKNDPRNAYILTREKTTILIDPGNREGANALLGSLRDNEISVAMVSAVVLQSAHCSNLSGLEVLEQNGLEADIIVNTPLPDTFETLTIKTLDEIDNELVLDEEVTLKFYQAPFLPFPDSFTTYVPQAEMLFSSHLFSQVRCEETSEKDCEGSIIYYHESTMPSSDFLKPVIKELKALNISNIHPLKGRSIEKKSVNEVLNRLGSLEFYNNHNVVSRRKKYNKYDYMEILNHMLKRLTSHYSIKEIRSVFKDSSITLTYRDPLEIKDTTLKGYKLWNGFFDRIYRKKGTPWIVILEPLVKKYTKLYNILKPTIYKSELMKRQKALSKIHEEKTALEEQVDRLSDQLTKTTDQLLRDDLTSLYNEQFFRKHLSNELGDYDLESERLGFLLIRVDRFKKLNRQYGKAAGDETIRNLSYIIERVNPENTVLFRQNGPGFFLYFGFSSIKKMKEVARNISNIVKDSNLFIEPISVSVYVSTSDDVSDYVSKESLASTLISDSRLKLERAQTAGNDLILDVKTVEDTYKDGYILVVDEDETMQNLLMLIFNRLHFEVIIAKDIYEAFETIKSTSIDAIISEINLSKLDGLQFKRWLNESHTYQSIPFIIASHHKNAEIIKRCNTLGVDFVLKKPLITEEITGLVQRLRKRNTS